MLPPEKQTEIADAVCKLNTFSEKYQLVHATFAIEQMYKNAVQEKCIKEIAPLIEQLKTEKDKEKKEQLIQRISELKKERNKTIKIVIDYIPYIQNNSARTTKTENNNFLIVLPQCMENIRQDDGKIEFNCYNKLRRLMAHELGHIVLHSDLPFSVLSSTALTMEEQEEEADFFAQKLIELRDEHTKEINRHIT